MQKLISATYHLKVRTAEYIAENGDHLLRSGGTVAWRFNNPGNMRPAKHRVISTFIGKAKMKGGDYFLIFPDYETGWAELKRLLQDPLGYADKSLEETIPKFAPKTDHNNPDKYIDFAESDSGVQRNVKFRDMTDAQVEKIMSSIQSMEGYGALTDTRSEKWVKAATVTLSDGAKPLKGQPVVVKQGGKEVQHVTDAKGRLPAIPKTSGDIEIMADVRDTLSKISTIAQQDASKGYLFVRQMLVAHASTAPQVPPKQSQTPARTSFTYRIEPGDTLSKIAQRFKTTVAAIKADNHLKSDLIVVGKSLQIYGPAHSGQLHKASSSANSHATATGHHSSGTAHTASQTQTATPAVTQPVSQTRAATEAVPQAESQTQTATAAVPQAASQSQTVPQTTSQTQTATQPDTQSSAATAPTTTATSTSAAASAPVTVARSQDGQGRPVGLIDLAQPRATWMAIAIKEAERWGGADESIITKTSNYHELIDNKNFFKSLVGSSNAWCAAFVTWVMDQDNRALLSSHLGRHRAAGYTQDPVNYPAISKPIFGAIAVLKNLGHVFFVYGKNHKDGNLVALGGNQGGHGSFGGTIDFAEFSPSSIHGYYVPASYLDFAKSEIQRGAELPDADGHEMNKLHKIKDPRGNGTR